MPDTKTENSEHILFVVLAFSLRNIEDYIQMKIVNKKFQKSQSLTYIYPGIKSLMIHIEVDSNIATRKYSMKDRNNSNYQNLIQ